MSATSSVLCPRSLAWVAALVALLACWAGAAPRQAKPHPDAAHAPAKSLLPQDVWKGQPAGPLAPGELDRLVDAELANAGIKPGPRASDEQLLRRLYLDLTGHLPHADHVGPLVASQDPEKWNKLVDALLASEAFNRHWARYWRDVVLSGMHPDRQEMPREFELWLANSLAEKKSWRQIAQEALTAEGAVEPAQNGKNGAAFFLARHESADADVLRAAETSRVFLGIQIQCAQCHDHFFDRWKRVQFHELTGFFARLKPAQPSGRGLKLVSLPDPEHEMADQHKPSVLFTTHPRFLDGREPPRNLTDAARRKALADFVTGDENYWFAASLVNRIWGELLGQAFYQPEDDLGPDKTPAMPSVVVRLAAAFRAEGYDLRSLLRAIVRSETYRRQTRLGETSAAHLQFAAAYPARLRSDVLLNALGSALGPMGESYYSRLFEADYLYDPATNPDQVEGSIPQVLWLMNSSLINERIRLRYIPKNPPPAEPGKPPRAPPEPNLVNRLLESTPDNDQAIDEIYLRVLARRPTDRERTRCREHLKAVADGKGNRAEGLEDLLWALVNSTEFLRRR